MDDTSPGADEAVSQAPTKRELVWMYDQLLNRGDREIAWVLGWVLTGDSSTVRVLRDLHTAYQAAQPDPNRWADGDEMILVDHGRLVRPPEPTHAPPGIFRREEHQPTSPKPLP